MESKSSSFAEMLRFKKILGSFICLTILAALAFTVSLKFGTLSLPKPRVEVAQANVDPDLNLSFIFEERDNINDYEMLSALPVELFLFKSILFASDVSSSFHFFTYKKESLKNSFYILFRSLRL